jgi:hypothetical protein
MKHTHSGLLVIIAVISLLFTSCLPETSVFDETLLIGRWSRSYTEDNQTKVEYYRYDNDGAGVTWVPAEDVTEAEGQVFTWVLDQSELTHIYLMEVSGTTITKIYTVTKLTSTTLEYKDDFNVTYTFTKVSKE